MASYIDREKDLLYDEDINQITGEKYISFSTKLSDLHEVMIPRTDGSYSRGWILRDLFEETDGMYDTAVCVWEHETPGKVYQKTVRRSDCKEIQ